jgi:hypothetical protein
MHAFHGGVPSCYIDHAAHDLGACALADEQPACLIRKGECDTAQNGANDARGNAIDHGLVESTRQKDAEERNGEAKGAAAERDRTMDGCAASLVPLRTAAPERGGSARERNRRASACKERCLLSVSPHSLSRRAAAGFRGFADTVVLESEV